MIQNTWRSQVDQLWTIFEALLLPVPSDAGLFNPYSGFDPALDLPDGPEIRRTNLRAYLEAYTAPPPVFILAEAPGPRGCRFSGVPLVAEAQLVDAAFPIDGRPSSTFEAPLTEYSAGIYWRAVGRFFPLFFTWNTVPFHPHKPGSPLSIRTPTRAEAAYWQPLLMAMLDTLTPEYVVAIGRTAERALLAAGADPIYIRHPSQGGARIFAAGIQEVLTEAGARRPLRNATASGR